MHAARIVSPHGQLWHQPFGDALDLSPALRRATLEPAKTSLTALLIVFAACCLHQEPRGFQHPLLLVGVVIRRALTDLTFVRAKFSAHHQCLSFYRRCGSTAVASTLLDYLLRMNSRRSGRYSNWAPHTSSLRVPVELRSPVPFRHSERKPHARLEAARTCEHLGLQWRAGELRTTQGPRRRYLLRGS